jgi:hypothetical protein
MEDLTLEQMNWEIGAIRKATEIGRRGTHKYSWLPCLDCGKMRWVALHGGKPYRLRCRSCACKWERHPSWKGGVSTDNGYTIIRLKPDDFFYPMANKQGYVREHRLVIAKQAGRNLHGWEVIHHKNHIKDDNRLENLQLVSIDKHRQITILENMVSKLRSENKKLRGEVQCLKKQQVA